jgi:hypothetical protein
LAILEDRKPVLDGFEAFVRFLRGKLENILRILWRKLLANNLPSRDFTEFEGYKSTSIELKASE